MKLKYIFFVQFDFLKLERGALGWLELAVGLCLFDLCADSENKHVYVHDFFSLKVHVLVMADQHLVAAVKAFRNCFPGGPESHKFLVADPDVLVEKPRGTVLGAAAAAEKNDNFFSTKCNRQSLP